MACNCEPTRWGVGYNKYWKLPCPEHTLAKEARASMDKKNFYYPKSVKKGRAIQLHQRAERGLISYDKCSAGELRTFMKARGLDNHEQKLTWKSELIAFLERADDRASFHRFTDLPPELRLRIYAFHFASFKMVSIKPAPVLAVSRLIRQEARPLFYEHGRFIITISRGLSEEDEEAEEGDEDEESGLMINAPGRRLFANLELENLSLINKLSVGYECHPTRIWNIDLVEGGDRHMVRYIGAPGAHRSGSDFPKQSGQAVTPELVKMAKEIAARPSKRKVQRAGLAKLIAPPMVWAAENWVL